MTVKEIIDAAFQEAIVAIITTYARRGVELSLEKSKEIAKTLLKRKMGTKGQIDIDKLAEEILRKAGEVGIAAYTEERLSQLLEIPIPELETIDVDKIQFAMFQDHLVLESEFKQWLDEWGYNVYPYHPLKGSGGVEYVPDVYGRLETIHGDFELCVNFITDDPPSEDRVFALLSKISTYCKKRKKKTHSGGSIFVMATPHRFTDEATKAIAAANEEEDTYCVLALEGGDIHTFETAETPLDRRRELRDKVMLAQDAFRNGRGS